jgi:hypothetical protein
MAKPMAISTIGRRTWPNRDSVCAITGRVTKKWPAAHYAAIPMRNTIAYIAMPPAPARANTST